MLNSEQRSDVLHSAIYDVIHVEVATFQQCLQLQKIKLKVETNFTRFNELLWCRNEPRIRSITARCNHYTKYRTMLAISHISTLILEHSTN